MEVAWQWNTGYNEGLHTFANGISTTEGGMHAEGFKRALTQAINRYARDSPALKAKSSFQGDDVREGMTAIVSVRLEEPQFEGQTKAKLGNTEIRSLVERTTNAAFGRWLEEHPNPAKTIVSKARLRISSIFWELYPAVTSACLHMELPTNPVQPITASDILASR